MARAAVPGSAYGDSGYGDSGYGYGDGGHGYGDPGYGNDASTGRAAVGTAVAGRASVGRASVPVSPAAGGPAGPSGPGGRGPGGRGPGGRRSGGGLSPDAAAKAKRRRRLNWIIGAFAVLIMLAGGTVVGVTFYSTNVTLPTDFNKLDLSSTLLYAGGKKEIAKLGEVNRVYATIKQIPDHVQKAVASAEDRKFYEHKGIDYAGIMRAAWNNVTGGDQQGASTITQQYARNAMKLTDVTYARKAKEAVLASKLNDNYDKDEIMEFYLNTIYFGRGAHSIESAAQAYFKKPVNKLTVAEAAVLAAVIKQPVPSDTHKGYDPAINPQDAQDRWNYVLDGMQEKGWLPAGTDRAALKFPEVQPWDDTKACGLECGLNTPAGNVINYVKQELAEMVDSTTGKRICQAANCMETIRKEGLRITTSVSPTMQKAAEETAWRKKKGSALASQPTNLMAAMVSIDPKTGRVLAYFGGENSTGFDYAGRNLENGEWTGGHPPGSSFKVYTLAAALQNNISLKSRWDGREIKKDNDNGDPPVENAGRTADCGQWCTLAHSTLKSYNVPFYYVTKEIGVDKVIDTAKAAGITMMWGTNPVKAYDLLTTKTEDLDRKVFDRQIGFGQYGVTVLDHANGLATLANRGVYNKAHFVVTVEKKDRATGKYVKIAGEQRKPEQRIPKQVADDVTFALQPIAGANGVALKGNRKSAAKTGTWQYAETDANAHAWTVGYTPQVATAVWVGDAKDAGPIKNKFKGNIGGGDLPATIWQRFMDEALEGKEKLDFPEPANVGDDSAGNGKAPERREPDDCIFGFLCPGRDGDNGGQNGDPNGGGQNGDPNGGGQNGGNNGGQNGGNNGGGQNGGNNGGQNTLPGLPPNPDTPPDDDN